MFHFVKVFPKGIEGLKGKVNLKIEALHLMKEDMRESNVTNEPYHNTKHHKEKDSHGIIQPSHDRRGERCLDHANGNQQKDESI